MARFSGLPARGDIANTGEIFQNEKQVLERPHVFPEAQGRVVDGSYGPGNR